MGSPEQRMSFAEMGREERSRGMQLGAIDSCEDYTPQERASFVLHICFALASIPLNFINGYAGLLVLPYLLFLTLRPKSQYLLPIIIILAYSSPLRLFFCTACFLYVLFHSNQLRRYGLFGAWCLYLCLSPFFIWYFYQKTQMSRYLAGVGDLASGFGTYFMFACAFWSVLCIRRMGVTFLKGLFYWSLFLVLLMSFIAVERDASMVDDAGKSLFTRQLFLAIPVCAATFAYFILERRRELRRIGLLAGFACIVLALDFFKILRYSLTFTCLGLMVFSSVCLSQGIIGGHTGTIPWHWRSDLSSMHCWVGAGVSGLLQDNMLWGELHEGRRFDDVL